MKALLVLCVVAHFCASIFAAPNEPVKGVDDALAISASDADEFADADGADEKYYDSHEEEYSDAESDVDYDTWIDKEDWPDADTHFMRDERLFGNEKSKFLVEDSDPDYPIYNDPFTSGRRWSQVTMGSYIYKWRIPVPVLNLLPIPLGYHTGVFVANEAHYNPGNEESGAVGYEVGQSSRVHEISGQAQFLRTDINSRPKTTRWKSHRKKATWLAFQKICLTDRTHEELLKYHFDFYGPYCAIRNNCHDATEYLLTYACGPSYAKWALWWYRSYFLKMFMQRHQIDPNYQWRTIEYNKEGPRAPRTPLTLEDMLDYLVPG